MRAVEQLGRGRRSYVNIGRGIRRWMKRATSKARRRWARLDPEAVPRLMWRGWFD